MASFCMKLARFKAAAAWAGCRWFVWADSVIWLDAPCLPSWSQTEIAIR